MKTHARATDAPTTRRSARSAADRPTSRGVPASFRSTSAHTDTQKHASASHSNEADAGWGDAKRLVSSTLPAFSGLASAASRYPTPSAPTPSSKPVLAGSDDWRRELSDDSRTASTRATRNRSANAAKIGRAHV